MRQLISAPYKFWYIISNYNQRLNISNFSRRASTQSGIKQLTVMAFPAQSRAQAINVAVVDARLVLALSLVLSLLLVLVLAGPIGGAGT